MTDDKQIFRPKITKTILFVIVCLAFTIGGITMTDEDRLTGWLCASFFGLGVIVFLIQLIPGSTQLTLTKEGFIMTNLFRSHLTKWSDVKEFKIGYIGRARNKFVMFDYTNKHKKYGIGKSIAKSLSGSHGALPSNYGFKVSELVSIMNDWKNKYGA
jgi:hypothetical protein